MVQFRTAQDAVSPVIATILLVAITMVLAGSVFLMLNELGEPKQDKPQAAFKDQQTDKRLLVISAPHDLDWNHIKIEHSGCGLPLLNGANAVLSHTRVTSSNQPVHAGDYILVFPVGQCEVQLTHIGSNSLLGTWTFS